MAPLAEGTDYEIVKDEREDARATTGALVHEMQPLFFQPGKSDWNTFEMIRSFAARGENVAGLNANTDGAYAIGSNRNTEIHTFQIRHGMDPEIATIQWEMLSNAEFSVAIPPLFRTAHRGQPLLQRSGCLLRSLRRGRRREQRGAQELHQLRPHGHQHARL